MKYLAATLLIALPISAAAAGGPVALGPNNGQYGDWTAATYGDGVDKACYAFTKLAHSDTSIPNRGPVLLTVTERKASRDEVTISAGYTYLKDAKVKLTVGTSKIEFYTQDGDAFTEGGKEAVTAMRKTDIAQAKSTGPVKGVTITDDFSLKGFSDAYAAIIAACP